MPSVDRLTAPDVPLAVCGATGSSPTKPHLPTSPFGFAHGLPASDARKIWTRLLPRSHTYSRPSLASLAQCSGLRKKAGFSAPLRKSPAHDPTPSPSSPPFSPTTGFCP